VKGVLHAIHAVLPGMIARGRGDVVLLGSVAGRQVYPGGAVYCATKHAVRAIYETLRLDAAGSGVRFTTVDPGMVGETEFSRIRFRGDEARAKAVYQGVDYLKPEDVAEAILWAVTRPARVNVGEIVLWASAQASTTVLTRSRRLDRQGSDAPLESPAHLLHAHGTRPERSSVAEIDAALDGVDLQNLDSKSAPAAAGPKTAGKSGSPRRTSAPARSRASRATTSSSSSVRACRA